MNTVHLFYSSLTGCRPVRGPARHSGADDGEGGDPGRGAVGGLQGHALLEAQEANPRVATRE